MKQVLAAAILGLSATAALAQPASPPANQNPSAAPAIATPSTNKAGAPAAGANSFTEDQAKSRIEAAGYTSVSGL